MASPKQIAYLTYLGFQNAGSLDFGQANEMIEAFWNVRDDQPEIGKRIELWSWERHILHPDLYGADGPPKPRDIEISIIVSLFGDAYRDYVRRRHKGCSSKLTHEILVDVVNIAWEQRQPGTTDSPDPEVIYQLLCERYPACVDGAAPVKTVKEKIAMPEVRRAPVKLHRPVVPKKKKRSGCSFVFAFGALLFAIWALH